MTIRASVSTQPHVPPDFFLPIPELLDSLGSGRGLMPNQLCPNNFVYGEQGLAAVANQVKFRGGSPIEVRGSLAYATTARSKLLTMVLQNNANQLTARADSCL